MLSVLENPKTAAHEEQWSHWNELKELLSLTDFSGLGELGGAQSSIWEGFKHPTTFAEHPTPSQPSLAHGALGMSPAGGGC